MSTVGGFSSGLAFLATLLAEQADGTGIESILSGWVRANGWRSAGIVWPVDAPVRVVLHAKPGDEVVEGQPLLTLHTDTPERFDRARDALAGAYAIGDEAPAERPLLIDRIA